MPWLLLFFSGLAVKSSGEVCTTRLVEGCDCAKCRTLTLLQRHCAGIGLDACVERGLWGGKTCCELQVHAVIAIVVMAVLGACAVTAALLLVGHCYFRTRFKKTESHHVTAEVITGEVVCGTYVDQEVVTTDDTHGSFEEPEIVDDVRSPLTHLPNPPPTPALVRSPLSV
eukprot:TRINITY_DN20632_c0_g1_i1.p1 TRINITY_DN20632_c0_g1~~TRINITY_DN20632_c0_g1_i1.p1  ORF type:complete len:188 (+),score=51.71 TRINITY_DN20632_c0_g1_i1:56-565(+)